MDIKLVNIQKQIDEIITKEFEEFLKENCNNLLIKLLLEDKLEAYEIDKLVEELMRGAE